jgi:hypothetical protein
LENTKNRITKKILRPTNTAQSKKARPPAATTLKNLNELRMEGLIYGVSQGMNIIYDTTFTSKKDKLSKDIMPILEMNKTVKYQVVVLLITAPETNVKKRLSKRHKEMMLEDDPYIRAVDPTHIEYFIEENKKGFDNAKLFFESGQYETTIRGTVYDKSDFRFREIENPQMNL